MISARDAALLTKEGLQKKEAARIREERQAAIDLENRLAGELNLLPTIFASIEDKIRLAGLKGESVASFCTTTQLHPRTEALICRQLRVSGYLVTIERYGGHAPTMILKIVWP